MIWYKGLYYFLVLQALVSAFFLNMCKTPSLHHDLIEVILSFFLFFFFD
jgi:hypothetical protein